MDIRLETEARRDNDVYRHNHHDTTKHDEPPRYQRLLDHNIALLLRLLFDPIRYHHAYDRREMLIRGRKPTQVSLPSITRSSVDYNTNNKGNEEIDDPVIIQVEQKVTMNSE